LSKDFIAIERERLLAAYRNLPLSLTPEIYAPWQPAEQLAREERKRVAARLLRKRGSFPRADHRCLEVGCGTQGWLGELASWGVAQRNLHGIELDATRVEAARTCLPLADIRVGDATNMPWEDACFQLVIASTVFSSILDARVRELLAREIVRVLTSGGVLLWYDFAFNNPRNPHVRRVSRDEIRMLFPDLAGPIQSVTLAPPLARAIAPRSWIVATVLQAMPLLRTHLLAVLEKP